MAELTASCCDTATQASCCEPEAKTECCDPAAHAAGSCGCSAGQHQPDAEQLRETVRVKYAAAALAAASGAGVPWSCCGPSEVALTDAGGVQVSATRSTPARRRTAHPRRRSLRRWGVAFRPQWLICMRARRFLILGPALGLTF